MYKLILAICAILTIPAIVLSVFWMQTLWLLVIVAPFMIVALYDVLQPKHTILRNFPLIGRFRFIFEAIRPQIHQYMVESDQEGRPLNREQRSLVYQRGKGALDTQPYGTQHDVYEIGYEWINHSLKATTPITHDPRIMIGNEQCDQPYHASLLNVSAMSFGALSHRAVEALNWGAKEGNFFQNTGEGGLTTHHLKHGGDICWQIGTGYFGCRTPDGNFCKDSFKDKANHEHVKLIEIKLSQGAKPGHGGILPAIKVTPEIAKFRGVPIGEDCISPPVHSAFKTPIEFMEYIQHLRELTGGKPIGFKLCLGLRAQFFSICKAMLKTKIYPDFITVDGAEGGTGAAPLEFANAVGTPLVEALAFVHNALVGTGVRKHIRIICSGKIITAFQLVTKLAIGADACNSARGMMLAVGCVQSLKCNNNHCPTGVTTHNPDLIRGLVVKDKYRRATRFHHETVKTVMELVASAGLTCPTELTPRHIYRRISATQVKPLSEIYSYIEEGSLLSEPAPAPYDRYWHEAKAESF